jgi:hypothetical protein
MISFDDPGERKGLGGGGEFAPAFSLGGFFTAFSAEGEEVLSFLSKGGKMEQKG